MSLAGRRIVLGVSGGIAAYKAVEICRRLVDAGAHVAPVLTEGALRFIGRTTFDALASEQAHVSLWDDPHPIPHTHLGQTADLVVVAPGHGPGARPLRRRHQRRPAHQRPAGHAGAGPRGPGDAHRDVGARRRCRTTWRRCAAAACTWSSPRSAAWPAATSAPAAWPSPPTIVAAAERVARRAAGPRGAEGARHRGRHPRADRPGPLHSNRSSGKQGHALADEAAARGAQVTLVTTVDRPVAAGVEVVRRRDRRRDGRRRARSAPTAATWS